VDSQSEEKYEQSKSATLVNIWKTYLEDSITQYQPQIKQATASISSNQPTDILKSWTRTESNGNI